MKIIRRLRFTEKGKNEEGQKQKSKHPNLINFKILNPYHCEKKGKKNLNYVVTMF